MAVDRLTQEVVTQQLQAALVQLDIIINAIRENDEATSISLVYLSTVDARTHLDEALRQLPWSPMPPGGRRRAVSGFPLPPPD